MSAPDAAPAETSATPLATRIMRVNTVLTASAPFSSFVSRPNENVRLPNGNVVRVSDKVVAATKWLNEQTPRIDACIATREQILRAGCAVTGIEPHRVIRARAKPKPPVLAALPPESRIRRVHATLRHSSLRANFSEQGVEIPSKGGSEIVSIDAYEIALSLYRSGREICSLNREQIYAAAIEYLEKVKGVKPETIHRPVEKLPAGMLPPLQLVAKPDAHTVAPVEALAPVLEGGVDEVLVARVEQILSEDPDTSEKVTERTVAMKRGRDGATVGHSRFALDLTRSLAVEHDPATMPKKRVLQAAKSHLFENGKNGTRREQPPLSLPIYSLVIGAIQIADMDTMPGADVRRKLLLEAANAYYPYTGLKQ